MKCKDETSVSGEDYTAVCACYNFKIVNNVFRKEKDCFLYLLILSVTSIIDIYCKMNIDKEQLSTKVSIYFLDDALVLILPSNNYM